MGWQASFVSRSEEIRKKWLNLDWRIKVQVSVFPLYPYLVTDGLTVSHTFDGLDLLGPRAPQIRVIPWPISFLQPSLIIVSYFRTLSNIQCTSLINIGRRKIYIVKYIIYLPMYFINTVNPKPNDLLWVASHMHYLKSWQPFMHKTNTWVNIEYSM